MLLRGLASGRACITLINIRQFDGLLGRFLRSGGHRIDRTTVLLVGRCDVQSQQIAKGVNGYMNLGALPSFIAIIAGAISALGSRQ